MMPEYYSKYDENYNYCIYKRGELLCIYHGELGKRYFERKLEDFKKRDIHVADML